MFATSYTERESGSKILIMAFGILWIIVFTVIPYIVGWLYGTSESFIRKTGMYIEGVGGCYFTQMLGSLVTLGVYVIMYLLISSRKPNTHRFSRTSNDHMPFVLKGWGIAMIVSCVCTALVSFVIYAIAFSGNFELVAPLMLVVWIAQAVLGVISFMIFVPMKKL